MPVTKRTRVRKTRKLVRRPLITSYAWTAEKSITLKQQLKTAQQDMTDALLEATMWEASTAYSRSRYRRARRVAKEAEARIRALKKKGEKKDARRI